MAARTGVPGSGSQSVVSAVEVKRSALVDMMSCLAEHLPGWGASAIFHAALILVCVFLVMAVQPPPPMRPDVDATAIVDPKLPVTKPLTTKEDEPDKTEVKSRKPKSKKQLGEDLDSVLPKLGDPRPDKQIIASLTPKGEIPRPGDPDGKNGLKDPKGDGRGRIFGPPRGDPGGAKDVVYVIDRSGSMTDTLDYVKMELRDAIRGLGPECRFHVIFFSSGKPVEMAARRLIPATRENVRKAFEFIDQVVAAGQTNPTKAVERAFGIRPELVYLLTDGEFDRSIVDLVSGLNKNGKVAVNTISFIYRTGEEVLRQIAGQNKGTYRFVSEDELASLRR